MTTPMTTLFGRVSYPMSRASCYLRVAVPDRGGVPLSIKASIGGFTRNQFNKGTVVEVAQSPDDGRRFRVVAVYEDTDDFDGTCDDTCDDRPEDTVTFYIGSRYFQDDGMRRRLKGVLRDALDMTAVEADMHMQDYGFWVTCRAIQFTKFMLFRDRAGIPNGFIDLRAQLDGPRLKAKQIDVTGRKSVFFA